MIGWTHPAAFAPPLVHVALTLWLQAQLRRIPESGPRFVVARGMPFVASAVALIRMLWIAGAVAEAIWLSGLVLRIAGIVGLGMVLWVCVLLWAALLVYLLRAQLRGETCTLEVAGHRLELSGAAGTRQIDLAAVPVRAFAAAPYIKLVIGDLTILASVEPHQLARVAGEPSTDIADAWVAVTRGAELLELLVPFIRSRGLK